MVNLLNGCAEISVRSVQLLACGHKLQVKYIDKHSKNNGSYGPGTETDW